MWAFKSKLRAKVEVRQSYINILKNTSKLLETTNMSWRIYSLIGSEEPRGIRLTQRTKVASSGVRSRFFEGSGEANSDNYPLVISLFAMENLYIYIRIINIMYLYISIYICIVAVPEKNPHFFSLDISLKDAWWGSPKSCCHDVNVRWCFPHHFRDTFLNKT